MARFLLFFLVWKPKRNPFIWLVKPPSIKESLLQLYDNILSPKKSWHLRWSLNLMKHKREPPRVIKQQIYFSSGEASEELFCVEFLMKLCETEPIALVTFALINKLNLFFSGAGIWFVPPDSIDRLILCKLSLEALDFKALKKEVRQGGETPIESERDFTHTHQFSHDLHEIHAQQSSARQEEMPLKSDPSNSLITSQEGHYWERERVITPHWESHQSNASQTETHKSS